MAGVGAGLDQIGQHLAVLVGQSGRRAWSLAVDQAGGPMGVELHHPIAHDLHGHAADTYARKRRTTNQCSTGVSQSTSARRSKQARASVQIECGNNPMPDNAMDTPPKHLAVLYLCLLLLQTFGSAVILWNGLPIYRRILLAPGQDAYATLASSHWAIAAVLVVQGAYWYRLMRVAVPPYGPHIVASHLLLFVSRLGFIFGAALFSAVFVRHLPEMTFTFGLSAVNAGAKLRQRAGVKMHHLRAHRVLW
jgi:hypothetical protein